MGEWGDGSGVIKGGEVKLPPQQHQTQSKPAAAGPIALEYEWVLFYDEGSPKGQSFADYESSMIRLGSFATVQDFWRYWNNIGDISKFHDYSNLRMFKLGIKPMWEDKANIDGGKWVVHCNNKEQTSNFTIKIVLAIIGEQLEYGEDICGMVLSVRPKGDTLNIWNRCGKESTIVNTTTAQLSQLIEAPVKYQTHREAITYNKSFHIKSPKPNQYNNTQSPLRLSTEDVPNLDYGHQGNTGPNNLSMSTGVLPRNHLQPNRGLPPLDLDGGGGGGGPLAHHVRGKEGELTDSIKNKVTMAEKEISEEKGLQPQARRHRDSSKHHKKSKSMSVVEAESQYYSPYLAASSSSNSRKWDGQVPFIVPPLPIITPPLPIITPPLPIITPPIPGLSLTSIPPSSNTSFRKQHRKSASVSVESVHSHPKTHSRTPSSDTTRKHASSSKSPLLTSINPLQGNPPQSTRGNKPRLSPPLDSRKHTHTHTRTQSLDPSYNSRRMSREIDLHSADFLFGGGPRSSKLRRTPVDELIIDDVVVKELLGGGDEEDDEIAMAEEDAFRPRAFMPIARRPSIKDGKYMEEASKKKAPRTSRKDVRHGTHHVASKASAHVFFTNTKSFVVEHVTLLAMIAGICMITVALQQW